MTTKSTIPLAPLRSMIEDLTPELREKLALLIRYTEAESHTDRGGTEIDLEQEAWRGMETLLREIRDGVTKIETVAEQDHRRDGVTGGAR